jgi:hypothetical protein
MDDVYFGLLLDYYYKGVIPKVNKDNFESQLQRDTLLPPITHHLYPFNCSQMSLCPFFNHHADILSSNTAQSCNSHTSTRPHPPLPSLRRMRNNFSSSHPDLRQEAS